MREFIPEEFDQSGFHLAGFVARIEKPWGFELLLTDPSKDLRYVAKMLHINQGGQLSLQVHDEKVETQILVNGQCIRIVENEDRNLIEEEMVQGVGYTIRVGQRHSLKAVTDCDIFEASTPEVGTTWRLSDSYGRGHETEEIRLIERSSVLPK